MESLKKNTGRSLAPCVPNANRVSSSVADRSRTYRPGSGLPCHDGLVKYEARNPRSRTAGDTKILASVSTTTTRRNGNGRRIAHSHHTAASAPVESADSGTPENQGHAGARHRKYSDQSIGAARSTRDRKSTRLNS